MANGVIKRITSTEVYDAALGKDQAAVNAATPRLYRAEIAAGGTLTITATHDFALLIATHGWSNVGAAGLYYGAGYATGAQRKVLTALSPAATQIVVSATDTGFTVTNNYGNASLKVEVLAFVGEPVLT